MDSGIPRLLLLSGPLMLAVGAAFVIGWKAGSRTPLRWFWAGAAIWTAGVALKVVTALLLNKPVFAGLKALLPRSALLVLGAGYIGLLTGVFEIGVTLMAALKWQGLARNAKRAVAVGVGAGAFEAILLGTAALISALVALSNLPGSQEARTAITSSAAHTSLPWLTGTVERIIAILVHTSSRTLVLLSVARRRWCFFWYGFLLLSAVDAIAGFVLVSDIASRVSIWWVELAIAPFALASVPIIRWCIRHWPAEPGAEPEPLDRVSEC